MSQGYATKNHIRKDMLLHSLHVLWNTYEFSKEMIVKPLIYNYCKYNTLVFSDEIINKQQKIVENNKRCFENFILIGCSSQ